MGVPTQLRLITWNVGRMFRPGSKCRMADDDVPRVATSIRELAADVVLLQELVDETQLARLVDGLPGYEGGIARGCRYDRRVASVARSALHPTFTSHVLEPTGRGVSVVGFDVAGGRGVAHSVHLDVRQLARKRSQVEGLIALGAACAESLVALGGDFNLDPRWVSRLRIRAEMETFERLRESYAEAAPAAGPTLLGLLRVDHVLVRKPALSSYSARVARDRRLPRGDHAPLVVDITG